MDFYIKLLSPFLSKEKPNSCLENGFCVSALALSVNKWQLRKKLILATSINWILTVLVSLM